MGKGDKKSKRGKIWGGSFGVRRPKHKKPLHIPERKKNVDTKIEKTTSIAAKESEVEVKTQVLEPQVAEITTETKAKVTSEPKTKSTSVKKETAKKETTKKGTAKKETVKKATTKKTTAKKAEGTKETKPTKKTKKEEETK